MHQKAVREIHHSCLCLYISIRKGKLMRCLFAFKDEDKFFVSKRIRFSECGIVSTHFKKATGTGVTRS